jgi:hypothetical protein
MSSVSKDVSLAKSYTFTINQSQMKLFKMINFYLANNIYNLFVSDKKQLDPNFRFVKFITPNPVFSIHSQFQSSTPVTTNKYVMLADTEFVYEYNGIQVRCKSQRPGMTTDFIEHTSIVNQDIYLELENTEETLLQFDTMIKDMTKYATKYMEHLDMEGDQLSIYTNDDGFWDLTTMRRKRQLNTIYLPKEDKAAVLADLEHFMKPETIARYDAIGRNHKRVYLFEGIPGGGKTTFIMALASHFNYNIAVISFTEKVTDGSLIRLIKNLPEKTFLVMEDIDVLFNERKKNDDMKNTITFSGILNNLDGITTPAGFVCFMTTNYKSTLDTALMRPGRVDYQMKFKSVVKEQLQDIFINFMGDKYTDELFKRFYRNFAELNLAVSMSLIQEYLFKYLDSPEKAIDNVQEIVELNEYTSKSNIEGMYR